uniref:Ubiquitin-like protease family profile domain-containing protein n=1 Tax=Triticum aestivum TaxID=4565 RepID=A0A077S6J4_WHEAT|nr:unnamed protein product [Triticum aestivum]
MADFGDGVHCGRGRVLYSSPLKRHKPNVDIIYDRRPSMASFNFDCESKDARPVTKADQNIGSADVDFEFHPTRNKLSPIVPVRLSQRFIDEVDQVQCSQYVSERLLNSHVSPFEQLVGLDEVQVVGTSTFSDRCVNFAKKTNEAYNRLNNLASSSSVRPGVSNSPEVLIISDPEGVVELNAAQKRNELAISKFSNCSTATTQHVPRRIVGAARFNSDPYVQQLNRFPVTLQERKHYFAMNRIGSDKVWCKYEAIRYDRAFCSYRSLSSLCPGGHLDNFLILCFCRFLFNKCHPSKSKKHFFFSYIGECILNNNNPLTRNPNIVRNAFEGACSAFVLWRSDFLYFPIGHDEHWFSFVVCIKDRAFVFLDSAYGENSSYHRDIRNELVGKVHVWTR